jgi:hypothetical protein
MNQKGFANVILIILVVVLAGALGYVILIKKSAPAEQPQSNNLQNTQTTTPPPTNNTVSQNQPPTTKSSKELSGLVSITFPSYCSFSGSIANGWVVDCGKNTKNDARGFMDKILEPQGWKLCESGLAHATWWKNGILTEVAESENDSSAVSYPFRLTQRNGEKYGECQ